MSNCEDLLKQHAGQYENMILYLYGFKGFTKVKQTGKNQGHAAWEA